MMDEDIPRTEGCQAAVRGTSSLKAKRSPQRSSPSGRGAGEAMRAASRLDAGGSL
jgi:hypothetical protein